MLKLDHVRLKLGENNYCFNLQADSHSVSSILGKSGSGKSTLLNLIAGFLQSDAGQIHWDSQSLNTLPANQRPVTTLFQQHNLFAHLNVVQNIGLGINPRLKLSKDDYRSIESALDEVGLNGYSAQSAATLSGGEQQRVALARCLLRKQPILLLDEPFSALDENTRHDMTDLTKRVVSDHNLCAILVTHNENDADRLGAVKYKLTNGELTHH